MWCCSLTRICPAAAYQFAAAFGNAAVDGDRHAIQCHSIVGSDNFIDAVRFAAGIALGAFHLVAKAGDGFAVNIVLGRAGDDFAAVVGGVADYDDLQGHFLCLYLGVSISRCSFKLWR